MAGETTKTKGVCLNIYPWSKTSHIVSWLTPKGRITTSVKGAARPKSAFLGQYDLNYECEIVYYLGAKGDVHALRECAPTALREELRLDYKKLLLAEHFRAVAESLAPSGPDAENWFDLLTDYLDRLSADCNLVAEMLSFEIKALELTGLSPKIEADSGSFALRGERRLPVSREVAQCISDPRSEKKFEILLDASRVIGVFYTFHLDQVPRTRRFVLQAIQQ
jgi:DNA repair protein RecO